LKKIQDAGFPVTGGIRTTPDLLQAIQAVRE
jgi:hypothetical protein